MSTNMTVAPKPVWSTIIAETEQKFVDCKLLDFKQEQVFATQALISNDYLMKIALQNKTSLRLAMLNVAAIGLTLNPSQGLAYLIPRLGKVTVDISYKGLINLAIDCGAIAWAKAELVYEEDNFVYKGPASMPEHHCNPFSKDRGNVLGGYCVASLNSGGVMVEAMSKGDMDQIRNSSEAFKNKKGPWIEWESQMQLKSIVKRAFKWWPKSTPRMANAIQMLNEENGEGLASLTVNSVEELPEPPNAYDVPVDILQETQRYVNRAVASGAYEACSELIHERIKSPLYKSFALNELKKAKENNNPQPEVINS